MTHLAKFMADVEPRDLLSRVPDQSLVGGDLGQSRRTESNRITAIRGGTSRMAAFYSAAGRPILVRLEKLAPAPYFAFWFNPRTGGWHAAGRETVSKTFFASGIAGGPGSSAREFVPPSSGAGEDWVLALSAVEYL
jgi:hypothetical protein